MGTGSSKSKLTLSDVKAYVKAWFEAVERELATYDLPRNKDLFLKAALKTTWWFKIF